MIIRLKQRNKRIIIYFVFSRTFPIRYIVNPVANMGFVERPNKIYLTRLPQTEVAI